jgi:hypothetical protein
MLLNPKQLLLIAFSVVLFLVLYLGCDTTPPKIKDNEKSLSQNIETTSVQNILIEAKKTMTREQIAVIDLLNKELNSSDDSLKVDRLIALSSKWYEFNQPAIAGDYAQQIAELKQDEQSWSISGTTYALCIKTTEDQKVRDFCSNRAHKSFDNALSLNPENVEHKINKALVNVENPPNGQPMTGILELRGLNEKYPENTSVINQLAKLAIRTNQFDRAIQTSAYHVAHRNHSKRFRKDLIR